MLSIELKNILFFGKKLIIVVCPINNKKPDISNIV